jgi:hypothetical protein
VASSTGPVLAAGTLTFANEAIFAPLAGSPGAALGVPASAWKVIPATLGLALGLALLERLAPGFATGLAWLTLAAVLVYPVGTAGSPLGNISKILGYAK